MHMQDGIPELATVFGQRGTKEGIVTQRPVIEQTTSLAVSDVISDLLVNRPLRFHAGVLWYASNGHISNEYYPEDEHRLMGKI